jgi:acyl-coenzyme A thioesterase PaaI-like protein
MLQYTAETLEDRFGGALRASGDHGSDRTESTERVLSLDERHMTLRVSLGAETLRPGGVVSGPTLARVVDSAGWLMTMAHFGSEYDALTTDLSMQFLRGAPPGDLLVEATALRIGRRCIIGVDVDPGEDGPAVHAVVTLAPVRISQL